jgi:hypothetical protein
VNTYRKKCVKEIRICEPKVQKHSDMARKVTKPVEFQFSYWNIFLNNVKYLSQQPASVLQRYHVFWPTTRKLKSNQVWFEFLTAVTMKLAVFRVVAPCSLVWVYRPVLDTYYFLNYRKSKEL